MKVKYIFTFLLVLSLLSLHYAYANAEETPKPSSSDSEVVSSPKPEKRSFFNLFTKFEGDKTPEPKGSPRALETERLEEKRLRFCQDHEEEFRKRNENLEKLTLKMINVFDEIAKRVEDYYNQKLVPNGKTLSNYDALANDIEEKKNAAQSALDKAKADASGFSCNLANPKENLNQFRLDMQAVKKALHEYRTSIKNLIVAIRTLVGKTPEPADQ